MSRLPLFASSPIFPLTSQTPMTLLEHDEHLGPNERSRSLMLACYCAAAACHAAAWRNWHIRSPLLHSFMWCQPARRHGTSSMITYLSSHVLFCSVLFFVCSCMLSRAIACYRMLSFCRNCDCNRKLIPSSRPSPSSSITPAKEPKYHVTKIKIKMKTPRYGM